MGYLTWLIFYINDDIDDLNNSLSWKLLARVGGGGDIYFPSNYNEIKILSYRSSDAKGYNVLYYSKTDIDKMQSIVADNIELNGYNVFLGSGLTGYGYVGLYRLYPGKINFGGFMSVSGTTVTDDKVHATCEMWYK